MITCRTTSRTTTTTTAERWRCTTDRTTIAAVIDAVIAALAAVALLGGQNESESQRRSNGFDVLFVLDVDDGCSLSSVPQAFGASPPFGYTG